MDSTYNGVIAGVDYPATLGPAVSDRVVAMFVPGLERINEGPNMAEIWAEPEFTLEMRKGAASDGHADQNI